MESQPAQSTAPSEPVYERCQGNPGEPAHPATSGCIEPTLRPRPSLRTPEPTAFRSLVPLTLPGLPPAVPWHGRTLYRPEGNAYVNLVGLGPDDTIYVIVRRPLPQPSGSPRKAITDVDASLLALRPDGRAKPGWPAAGIHIPGLPMSWTIDEAGTVFLAVAASVAELDPNGSNRLTITAIGANGRVVAGWPYLTPPGPLGYDLNYLMPAAAGTVCFESLHPGARRGGIVFPTDIYCVGRDGKLLAGFPFESPAELPIYGTAIGRDGTVYIAQAMPQDTAGNNNVQPFQVLAFGRDGRPKPGWTAPRVAAHVGLSAIVPGVDGRVWLLLGGITGDARLRLVDSSGSTIEEHVEVGSILRRPAYKDAGIGRTGILAVSVDENVVDPVTHEFSDIAVVNVYAPDNAHRAGWPQRVGSYSNVAVGRDGSVWAVSMGDYAEGDKVVAAFDRAGRLRPGYPMLTDSLLSTHFRDGVAVASDGTAYATASGAGGMRIVAMAP